MSECILVTIMSGQYKGHEAFLKQKDDSAVLLIIEKNTRIRGNVKIIDEVSVEEHGDIWVMEQHIH